jgi:peptidoglycan/LPS O-acetylase OafA/YrhL
MARFCGDLSYPLYITHYPLIYIYTSWVVTSNRGVLPALLLAAVAIGIAYVSLKLCDEPVRRWLSKRLLTTPG